MFDVEKIRSDFPILSRQVYNKPLVYFDNAATTQKPLRVIEAVGEAYSEWNGNIHRGNHWLGISATGHYEEAREKVRKYINASSSDEIIFTRGATEGLNLLSTVWASRLSEGDEVIVSEMEHHSNIVPWQNLEKEKKIKLRVIPITDDYCLDVERFSQLVSDRTKLVSLIHVSNTLGVENNIAEIIKILKPLDIPIIIDASQSIPHRPIDVERLDCDFLVFSAHKMYAPTGIGVLYGKKQWLEALPPYQFGGDMIKRVSFEGTTFADLPFKYEAGTSNYVGAFALATAIDYLNEIGMNDIMTYEKELFESAWGQMKQIDELELYVSQEKGSTGTISFNVKKVHHYDVASLLDKYGIAVRSGTHCTQPLMDSLGIDGTVRASFAFYNTFEEIDYFIKTLKKVIKTFL